MNDENPLIPSRYIPILLGVLGFIGIGAIILLLLPPRAPKQTVAPAEATAKASATLAPTRAPVIQHMPATWTPQPSVTATRKVVPTRTPTPTITVTLAMSKDPKVLSGDGSTSTSSLPLPAGKVILRWSYSGSASEVAKYNGLVVYHENALQILEDQYSSTKSYYEYLIENAKAAGDADALEKAQDRLKKETEEYNDAVAAENKQFDTWSHNYATRFSIEYKRAISGEHRILVSTNGADAGVLTLTVEKGYDHFFTVIASGPWKIEVIPQP